MKKYNNNQLKFKETEFFFFKRSKPENFSQNELKLRKYAKFSIKYFQFVGKETMFNVFQKIFYRKLFETLNKYSSFLKTRQIKTFYGILFSIMNYSYLIPKSFLLSALLNVSKEPYSKLLASGCAKNFFSNFLKNEIVRDHNLSLSISYLKINFFSQKNSISHKKANLGGNSFFFLHKRTIYTKKNKNLRILFFKFFILFYIADLSASSNYKTKLCLMNTLILYIIEGKGIEHFWLDIGFIKINFFKFLFCDNYYQIFLPRLIFGIGSKDFTYNYSFLKIDSKFNLKVSLRTVSMLKSNKVYFTLKFKNLSFYAPKLKNFDFKKVTFIKFLILYSRIFRKTNFVQLISNRFKKFDKDESFYNLFLEMINFNAFFKFLKTKRSIFEIRDVNNHFFNTYSKCLNDNLKYFPGKIVFKRVPSCSDFSDLFFANNNKTLSLGQKFILKKYSPYIQAPIKKNFLVIRNKNIWVFLNSFKHLKLKNSTLIIKTCISVLFLEKYYTEMSQKKIIIQFFFIDINFILIKKRILSIFKEIEKFKNTTIKTNNMNTTGFEKIVRESQMEMYLTFKKNYKNPFKHYLKETQLKQLHTNLFEKILCGDLITKFYKKKDFSIKKSIEKTSNIFFVKFFIVKFFNFFVESKLKIIVGKYIKSFIRDSIRLRNSKIKIIFKVMLISKLIIIDKFNFFI